MKYLLDHMIEFSLESDNKRVRLVIYKNAEEWVCRKENISRIKEFLLQHEARLFKGRLQLSKVGEKIYVEVKGEVVGIIQHDDFAKMIDQYQ
jgi:hypothetical protein